jgi:hypothetical protein
MTCAEFFMSIFRFFGDFFVALFGAGFGAYAAFHFTSKKQQQDETKKQWGDVASVFYLLSARLSAAENFARKYLSDDRSKISEEKTFQYLYQQFPAERMVLANLTSLISGTTAQLIQDLSDAEMRYFNLVDAHNVRQTALTEMIKEVPVETKLNIPAHIVRGRCGQMLILQNDNLVKSVNWAVANLEEEIQKLSIAIKEKFPKMPRLSGNLKK